MILGLTQRIIVIDVETASPVDITTEGQHRYWAHPDTRVLMTGAKLLGDNKAVVYDHEARGEGLPPGLVRAINAPPEQCLLAAANCEFDRAGLERMGYPTPPEKWVDVLTCAYVLGFAGRLNDVLKQTPLEIEKNQHGARCISTFSTLKKAWHQAPDLWDLFIGYCANDAHVEEQLLAWCLRWLDIDWMRPIVQDIYRQELIYRRINHRGLPIDAAAVQGALRIIDSETADLMDQMRELTGLENPNSTTHQLKPWVEQQVGYPLPGLDKTQVSALLLMDMTPPVVKEVLTLRQSLGKTSTKKYPALAAATSDDGRLRGGWQFYGASRTGRVAGRVLNPANLPRPAIKHPEATVEIIATGDPAALRWAEPGKEPLDTLSSCIRACLLAPEGKRWCVADLTSIESVGLAWLAGCDTILDIFHGGRDTYRSFAMEAEKIGYEDVTKEQRSYYKPCVLGSGYGASGAALVKYAEGFGVELDEDEADRQVALFREIYHEIPHHWRKVEDAAKNAVMFPGNTYDARAVNQTLDSYTNRYGKLCHNYDYRNWPRISYYCDGTFLFCMLPSGRILSYFQPRLEEREIPRKDGSTFNAINITYMGKDQGSNAWTRIETRGAKLVENNTQALCRDILWHGLEQAESDPGLEVVGDVYDEILTLCDAEDTTALDRLVGYMTSSPPWLDDRFYLGADGYISIRYRKD